MSKGVHGARRAAYPAGNEPFTWHSRRSHIRIKCRSGVDCFRAYCAPGWRRPATKGGRAPRRDVPARFPADGGTETGPLVARGFSLKETTRLGGHAAVWHDVENLRVRGSREARPAQRDRPAMLPADAGSVAVALEAKQAMGLVAVEPMDRVVQPRVGVDVATARQRIVDVLGPGFFFKRTEDQLLNLRRHPEPLDDHVAET